MPARKRRRLLTSSYASQTTQSEPASTPGDPSEAGALESGPLKLSIRLNERVTIGRHAECTLVCRDPQVSKTQCTLSAFVSSSDDVLVTLSDTSLNGTLINGENLRKETRVLLNGDTVQIGSEKLKFTQKGRSALSRGPQEQHGDFVLLSKSLGSGSFATVSLAVDLRNKRQVACKIISKEGHNHTTRQRLQREIDVMLSLDHPNIVKLYEAFETDTRLYLMMQLSSAGDLFQLLEKRRCNGSESKWICYQLLLGLQYLHDECGISHRDLKPENILLDSLAPYSRISITDYGVARFNQGVATTHCGTLSYQSPEVIQGIPRGGYNGPAVDCWSLGVIAYFCLAGYHPFDYDCGSADFGDLNDAAEAPERERVISLVLQGKPSWPADPFAELDRDARTFIADFLNVSPVHRATASQGLASKWMTKSLKALKKSYAARVS